MIRFKVIVWQEPQTCCVLPGSWFQEARNAISFSFYGHLEISCADVSGGDQGKECPEEEPEKAAWASASVGRGCEGLLCTGAREDAVLPRV